MARLLLTLRYDGTAFHGWQVQPNAISVQETLQDAVERVTGVRAGVTGCSRTDAGVHADMFCCTLDTAWAASTDKFIQALNACLPPTVAVYDCRAVADGFHPRYDTQGKRYAYRIWNHPARNPFYAPYTLHIKHPLPVENMHQAARDFCGTHDFAAFCAAHSSVEDTVRTVRDCSVKREGDLVTFEVEADGFLYNMVRIMAGTLLDMAAGRIPFDAVPAILDGKDRAFAGQTAPAHALCLKEVYYNEREVGTWLTRKKSE
ncbi:MAG: tRNA pseudouridine(38-40) synthase TruA [Clostridia bacterium]|nr:tRNA pseudouridine(38-40) synthase TruA [Clostridia bacterium]